MYTICNTKGDMEARICMTGGYVKWSIQWIALCGFVGDVGISC